MIARTTGNCCALAGFRTVYMEKVNHDVIMMNELTAPPATALRRTIAALKAHERRQVPSTVCACARA